MSRRARSFMSTARFQVMRRTSKPSSLPWWRWLSSSAESRLLAQRDRVEVAGEVQVDVLHRHHLRVAAAGRTALDAEHRAERGLAQADDRLLADAVERVAEADRGGGLAFAGGRRADRRDQDQLAVGPVGQRIDVAERHLGLVVAVGHEVLLGDAELRRDLGDAQHLRFLGNLDVTGHGGLLMFVIRGQVRARSMRTPTRPTSLTTPVLHTLTATRAAPNSSSSRSATHSAMRSSRRKLSGPSRARMRAATTA